MKKIREGNIEFKKYTSTKTKEPLWEIVKWEKNPYYGKEEELRSQGYEDSFGGGFLRKNGHEIDKTFFKYPESCYVIAWVKVNKKEPDVFIESIGSRLLGLDEKEREQFWEVYKKGNQYLYKKYKI